MTDKLFSIRLSTEEYHALKSMAKREVRTANSWLRSRIVKEARELHLLNDEQAEMNQEDIPVDCYTPPAYEELSE
jgi:predicted DNA-binding protein